MFVQDPLRAPAPASDNSACALPHRGVDTDLEQCFSRALNPVPYRDSAPSADKFAEKHQTLPHRSFQKRELLGLERYDAMLTAIASARKSMKSRTFTTRLKRSSIMPPKPRTQFSVVVAQAQRRAPAIEIESCSMSASGRATLPPFSKNPSRRSEIA